MGKKESLTFWRARFLETGDDGQPHWKGIDPVQPPGQNNSQPGVEGYLTSGEGLPPQHFPVEPPTQRSQGIEVNQPSHVQPGTCRQLNEPLAGVAPEMGEGHIET